MPVADVVAFVRENARKSQAVHLGTDSLQLARHTRFVTVVAILTLVGLVVSQEFRAVIKPESWARAAPRTAWSAWRSRRS